MHRTVRPFLRDLAAHTASGLGLTSPRRWGSGRLSIATFHRVLPEAQRRQYPLPGLAVTPQELAWYLDYFSANFTVGPLGPLFEAWTNGDRPARPFLAVTFDDGQLDNFVHARPVLEQAGVAATFFIPVAPVERQQPIWHDVLGFAVLEAMGRADARRRLLELWPMDGDIPEDPQLAAEALITDAKALSPLQRGSRIEQVQDLSGGKSVPEWAGLMTAEQVAELSQAGHEIGSHSMTHPLLPQCDDDQLEAEIGGSRQRLEAWLGAEVHCFCYPNGDCDDRVTAQIDAAGYRCAVTTAWGTNAGADDRFRLRRFDMHAGHTKDRDGNMNQGRLAFRMSSVGRGIGCGGMR